MKITKDTRVFDILKEYGDIAEVMETFGLKRVGSFSLRSFIARFINVKMAARAHKVPLDELIANLEKAIQSK